MRFMLTVLLFGFSAFVFAEVKVDNAMVRLLPPGVPNTAGYFSLTNTGTEERVLVGVSCDAVKKAELHDHQMINGMMKMVHQQQVVVPAGQTLTFQPGGLHLMLFGLQTPLKEGQQVPFTLIFADGEQIKVSAVVRSAMTEVDHSHHHH